MSYRIISCVAFLFLIAGCSNKIKHLQVSRTSSLTGSDFYKQSAAMGWKSRDSFALEEFKKGNIPQSVLPFVPIHVSILDSVSGKKHEATYFVLSDYFSIGTDDDWARLPLTPMTANEIANSVECFLPTRKMVNDIYLAAKVKLEPVPMYAFRDSTPTMWQHHLIIEGQRKGRKGLIAGIKKDVVNSSKLNDYPKRDRVAIYGWHKPDGKPIQPLYTGHVNWYEDYSHGIRLVSQKIKVDGRWRNYKAVLNDPVLKRLLCDEDNCTW